MYTYVQRPGCKKENMAMCTYRRGLERLLAHTYGQGSCTWLGQNGETASSSCSWGGNRMRRVHGEATECVVVFIGRAWTEQAMETRPGIPQNGGNGLVFDQPHSKRDPVHREGSGVPQNGGNGPPTIETGVLLIGGVWRTAKRTKRTCVGALRSKRGSCLSRGVWRTAKRDSAGYCSSPPLTSSSLQGLPFIQPPWAPIHPTSTGSCSSSLHRALLHWLLFNHPSTVYCSS